jgi:hypothetical protein
MQIRKPSLFPILFLLTHLANAQVSFFYASSLNTRNVIWGVSIGYQFTSKKK